MLRAKPNVLIVVHRMLIMGHNSVSIVPHLDRCGRSLCRRFLLLAGRLTPVPPRHLKEKLDSIRCRHRRDLS